MNTLKFEQNITCDFLCVQTSSNISKLCGELGIKHHINSPDLWSCCAWPSTAFILCCSASTGAGEDARPAESKQPILHRPIWVIQAGMKWESIMYLINRSISPQLLQMTGKAAFQLGLIDISSQGKLLPPNAKSCPDTWTQREGSDKVLW